MAKKLELFERTVAQPGGDVSVGSGLDQLMNASQAVNRLVTEKLTNVAIDQAAKQGEEDARLQQAPTDLAPGFTRATAAYNKAVVETEASHMASSAQNQINEAYLKHANPANFTKDSPDKLAAEIEGIKRGTLDNARPEVRGAISDNMDLHGSSATLKLHQQAIKFDNEQAKTILSNDLATIANDRSFAAMHGDTALVAALDQRADTAIANAAIINQEINADLPNIKKKIESQRTVDDSMAGYTHSIETNTTPQFMKDLAENKGNLSFSDWQASITAVTTLSQHHLLLVQSS